MHILSKWKGKTPQTKRYSTKTGISILGYVHLSAVLNPRIDQLSTLTNPCKHRFLHEHLVAVLLRKNLNAGVTSLFRC